MEKLNLPRKFLKYWNSDIVAVVFLVWVAINLYFSHVTRMGLSSDGFLLTYFMQTGDLLAYNINEIKEPGRPFLGLAWHLASLLTGGTVTGYNAFMLSCLMSSAILIYFLVRTLLPRQPVWALLASTLKLVWIANYEIFDNSGLAIYFAETMFWLALWLLIILAVKYEGLSRFEVIFASIVKMACLVVLVGTYQTSWPVILITPLALLMLGVMRPRIGYTYKLLAIWYLATLPMMVWCYILSRQFLANIVPPIHEIARRLLIGLWATTGEALLTPFATIKHYPYHGITSIVVLMAVTFAALLVWMGMQSWSDFRDKSSRQVVRVLTVIAILSLTIIVISLLPPLMLYIPTYGTRFLHWSSIGTIFGITAILAGLYKMHPWIGGAISAFIASILVAGMMQQKYDIGNHYTNVGFQNRRFWEDLIIEIPNVDEGTIVLLDGRPAGIATADSFSTRVFRELTETHMSFFITDGKPVYDPIKKIYKVTSIIDLNQTEALVPPNKYNRAPKSLYNIHASVEDRLQHSQTFEVSANRVVWLKWDLMTRRLQVIPERSAMERLHRNLPSIYGQVLFPRLSIEHNRLRDVAPSL